MHRYLTPWLMKCMTTRQGIAIATIESIGEREISSMEVDDTTINNELDDAINVDPCLHAKIRDNEGA